MLLSIYHCCQAVVEDLFHNAQQPGRVGSQVKNPDPVASLLQPALLNLTKTFGVISFPSLLLNKVG